MADKARPGTTSRTIMMKKYKFHDDGTQKYVEQSTLLEPNNLIPNWEKGGEEEKEVSGTLRKLRKKFDEIHKQVAQREVQLDQTKKKIEQLTIEEQKVENDLYLKASHTEGIETELGMTLFEHDVE